MEPLPKRITKNGLEYVLNEETETYHLDIEEDDEPLSVYGQTVLSGIMNHNPIKFQMLMLEGRFYTYVRESEEICYQITQNYMRSVTEPEPENFYERVEWNQRHGQTARELAMAEANRRIFSVD
jgi:hypothetical protein